MQLVSDYSEVEMERRVGGDGMATEEYNFNSEVTIEHQVSFRIMPLVYYPCVYTSTHNSPASGNFANTRVTHV